MRLGRISAWLALSLLPAQSSARGKPSDFIIAERAPLQDIVTWDEHSLFVHGERIIFYGGEFHPFRLPVPSLWLDIFQKIKALGYNGVSFYSAWVLHESKEGSFQAGGIFDWEPYFEAAKEAGVYLVARPGPYINAEVSGGGFVGRLQRISGNLRTPDADYQQASKNYIESITPIIAKAQVTNGGPVILFQPENEYSAGINVEFPDADYMNHLMKQYRDLGIVVPLISNTAWPNGVNAPGTDAPVDIYGHDAYPLGMNCTDPTLWIDDALPTTWRKTHLEQSPNTPYMLVEYQGGAYQPWGGDGFEKCAEFTNHEFERVFYKNNIAAGATIFNVYMTFGGTNWGNLGHAGGYTSYDYGAAITEERQVHREKYSEAKLIANFVHASPALASAVPGYNTSGVYTDTNDITTTPLHGNETSFYVTRHTKYNSMALTPYKITLQTSAGNLTLPQLGGKLSINGRDSKIHVTDYDVGGFNLLYSTAEIFTWKKYGSRSVLLVYGGPNEQHELAVSDTSGATAVEGSGVKFANRNGNTILNWQTTPERRVVRIGSGLYILILSRNDAYNYWTVSTLPAGDRYSHLSTSSSDLIVHAGYLVRSASISPGKIQLVGDINATTTIEVVGGAHEDVNALSWNGKDIESKRDRNGFLSGSVLFSAPQIQIPDLKSLVWKSIDALPELEASYDDSAWTDADHTTTNNTYWNLTTPTVLWGAEYGYNTGSLIFRGHFSATGNESLIHLNVSGGSAFAFTAWVNSTFLASWTGTGEAAIANQTLLLPKLQRDSDYVLTVLVDHMGHNGNWFVGYNEMKTPRGILGYDFLGHTVKSSNQSRADDGIRWKVTGNLGGEDYHGGPRGPLNEGALYPERNGFHLPSAPTDSWANDVGPASGLSKPGVRFYTTVFSLDIPKGWDVPLSFVFHGDEFTGKGRGWRAQLWVNGYQFGKFANGIGPQRRFPVPEGIFNYRGENTVAISIWALEAGGATPQGIELVAGTPVQSGYGDFALSPMDGWVKREGAH